MKKGIFATKKKNRLDSLTYGDGNSPLKATD